MAKSNSAIVLFNRVPFLNALIVTKRNCFSSLQQFILILLYFLQKPELIRFFFIFIFHLSSTFYQWKELRVLLRNRSEIWFVDALYYIYTNVYWNKYRRTNASFNNSAFFFYFQPTHLLVATCDFTSSLCGVYRYVDWGKKTGMISTLFFFFCVDGHSSRFWAVSWNTEEWMFELCISIWRNWNICCNTETHNIFVDG